MARNVAITIGVNQYQYEQDLQFAENDAVAMRTYLQKTGFEEVLHYSDKAIGYHPELTTLLRAVRRISSNVRLGKDDSFWFFFSGHGGRQQGRDFLLPSNGDPDDLVRTAIAIDEVIRALRECGAGNLVLILDACRNPVLLRGKNIGNQTIELVKQEGIITLFSCSPGEKSYELPTYRHGALTYALLQALQGECHPHRCNAKQLSHYLRQRVPQLTQALGQQRPYVIAEPIEKATQALLPSSLVTNPVPPPTNVAQLIRSAVRATQRQEWHQAKQWWEQVLMEAQDPEDRKLAMEQRDYVVSQQIALEQQRTINRQNATVQPRQIPTPATVPTYRPSKPRPKSIPASAPHPQAAPKSLLKTKPKQHGPQRNSQSVGPFRRDILKWLGFCGAGVVVTWIVANVPNSNEPTVSGPDTINEPVPDDTISLDVEP